MSKEAIMKCGHIADGYTVDSNKLVCVLCYGVVPGADEIDGHITIPESKEIEQ